MSEDARVVAGQVSVSQAIPVLRTETYDESLELMVRFAVPDQPEKNRMPLLRQLAINASTVVVPGKPMVVGSVDDPNSKHQFQLEVVATKLR